MNTVKFKIFTISIVKILYQATYKEVMIPLSRWFTACGCRKESMFKCREALRKIILPLHAYETRQHFSTSLMKFQEKKNKNNSPNKNTEIDEDMEQKLCKLRLEVESLRRNWYSFVPDNITDQHWMHLLKLPYSARLKHYKYLKLNELKKAKLKEERWIIKHKTEDHIMYSLNENAIMFKVRKATVNRFYENNLRHAVLFGQDLIVDMDNEDKMSSEEFPHCAKQLQYTILENRRDREPFHMHFCNIRNNSNLMTRLKDLVPSLGRQNPLITVTEQNYLEMFPKDKLIYLTPHCDTDLEFDHDKVYIIGGLDGKSQQDPLSVAKAKREGIQMARLPIDKYLKWIQGSKYLSLDVVMKILLTIRNTSDWVEALKNVPEGNYEKIS